MKSLTDWMHGPLAACIWWEAERRDSRDSVNVQAFWNSAKFDSSFILYLCCTLFYITKLSFPFLPLHSKSPNHQTAGGSCVVRNTVRVGLGIQVFPLSSIISVSCVSTVSYLPWKETYMIIVLVIKHLSMIIFLQVSLKEKSRNFWDPQEDPGSPKH